MPRDATGNFTLVSGNPVLPGEIVASSYINSTFSDVAQTLTESLDRLGRGGMLAPFRFSDGNVSAPGATWSNEPSSGFYRSGSGEIRASVLASNVMRWTTSGVDVFDGGSWKPVLIEGDIVIPEGTVDGSGQKWSEDESKWIENLSLIVDDANDVLLPIGGLRLSDGGSESPGFSFISSPNTGAYRSVSGEFILVTEGLPAISIDENQNVIAGGNLAIPNGALQADNGTIGSPSISFEEDQDTGFYRPDPGVIGAVSNGAEAFRIEDSNTTFNGNIAISGEVSGGSLITGDNPASSSEVQASKIQTLTQAEYDALSPPDDNTLYFIV